MSAPLLFLSLDIAVILGAVLLAARVLAARPLPSNAGLVALICACNVCHIILARHDYAQWIPQAFRIDVGSFYAGLNLARNLTPGLFMILCHGLFRERRPAPWLLVLFAVQALLEEPGRQLWASNRLLTEDMPALQMLFAAVSVWWAVESWRGDLVETRRRARAFVVIVTGINVVAVSLLLRVVIPWNTPANYGAHVVFIAFNLVTLLVLLTGLGTEPGRYLEPARLPARPVNNDARTAADLARLLSLFEVGHVHREPGLTLKDLARRAALPEYRVRRLIHEQLGYRNFNSFLHEWRIREACDQLRDPALSRTPILTIALSLGYQSVNTFNRGFYEITGTTPSAWRQGGE